MNYPRPFEDEILCSTLARYMLHHCLTKNDLAAMLNRKDGRLPKLHDDCLFMFKFIADRLKEHLSCRQLFLGHTVTGRLLSKLDEDFAAHDKTLTCKAFKAWARHYYDYLTAGYLSGKKKGSKMANEHYRKLRQMTNIDFQCIRYCPHCMKQRRSRLQDGHVKCSWQFLRFCPDCGNALEWANSWGLVSVMERFVKGIDAQGNDLWYGLQPLEKEEPGDKLINPNHIKLLKQLNVNAYVLTL